MVVNGPIAIEEDDHENFPSNSAGGLFSALARFSVSNANFLVNLMGHDGELCVGI